MTRHKRVVWLVVALVALIASLGCEKDDERDPSLPELGTIGSFSLVDQSGQAFSGEQLRGTTWVAAFMFTRCPTVCPRITRRMRSLQKQARQRELDVHLVSFSVDPENDTPEVLRRYADEYGADLSSWSFVTGDAEVVRRTAVEGFKVALEGTAQPDADHFGILHGSHLVLVDGHGTIRGYYRTSDDGQMQQLLDDAALVAPRS